MNRDSIDQFLEWRKNNRVIAEHLSDDDLERLFPILESYAEWRLKRRDVAARSTARRAFAQVIKLERAVKAYREMGAIDQHVKQLTRWRTWRWWMIARVWWKATKARCKMPLVHAQVVIGILRQDYTTGRRLEFINKWQSLPMQSVRRYGQWRLRWEVWLRKMPIERKWEPFERLRMRMLRRSIQLALREPYRDGVHIGSEDEQ